MGDNCENEAVNNNVEKKKKGKKSSQAAAAQQAQRENTQQLFSQVADMEDQERRDIEVK